MKDNLENLANFENEIEEIDKLRVRALESHDAVNYARLCDQLGLGLDSLEDVELYKLGGEYINYEEAHLVEFGERYGKSQPVVHEEKKKTRKKRVSKRQADYNLLKQEGDRLKVNVNNIFEDTEIKRRQLVEIMNYRALYIGKDDKIPIHGASPERVGSAYKRCYNSAD